MTGALTFSVVGTPRPQPRPRFVKGRAVSSTGAKLKLWRQGLARAVKAAVEARGAPTPLFPKGSPVRVSMVFTFRPPDSALDRIGTPHTHKPDAENLAKPILDIMETCGVYKNDSQASAAPPEKWWGERAGVAVLVEPMEGERREDATAWTRAAPDWLSRR